MMTSTYVALKSQGLSTRALRRAARLNFEDNGKAAVSLPGPWSRRFWTEIVDCRHAFRRKTGFDIEKIIGD